LSTIAYSTMVVMVLYHSY